MMSLGPTTAPAGSTSMTKDPFVSAATSAPKSLSITTSSAVLGKTDWMRNTFSANAAEAVIERPAAVRAAPFSSLFSFNKVHTPFYCLLKVFHRPFEGFMVVDFWASWVARNRFSLFQRIASASVLQILQNHIRCFFANHDGRRIGVSRSDGRHD